MPISASILTALPEEAQIAFKEGKVWNYVPDNSISGTEGCYYCDDCENYHRIVFVNGWRVCNHKLYHVAYEIEEGGEWTEIDWCDVDSPSYQTWANRYSDDATASQWREYRNFLNKNGKTNTLSQLRHNNPQAPHRWLFRACNNFPAGVMLLCAKPQLSRTWICPENLPEFVIRFLNLERMEGDNVWLINGFMNTDSMLKNMKNVWWITKNNHLRTFITGVFEASEAGHNENADMVCHGLSKTIAPNHKSKI